MNFTHEPIRLARSCTPREGMFLQRWQAYAPSIDASVGYDYLSNFERIFYDASSAVDQRRSSVAASFMTFMGCNGGMGFTWSCERMASSLLFDIRREDAFLAAWALDDKRCRGTNHGLRTSQYMLAAQHPIVDKRHGHRAINWSLVPDISEDDRDTLECMVRWWAGTDAKAMRGDVDIAYKKIEHNCYAGGVFA